MLPTRRTFEVHHLGHGVDLEGVEGRAQRGGQGITDHGGSGRANGPHEP